MMPAEYTQLRAKPLLLATCKSCKDNRLQDRWMRGLVQSTWRRWLRLPYCAVMCGNCMSVIGWEKP